MVIWLNGTLIADDVPAIRGDDRGFLLGDGVFETLRAQAGQIECLSAHLMRFAVGARHLGIPVPDGLGKALQEVLAVNGLTDAALRLTLSRGPGPRGLAPPRESSPTCLISATPWTPPAHAAHVVTVTTRRDASSPLSRFKSLSYLPQILARQEAGGADEALMLNHAGGIACASAANIFARIGGIWITPPLSEGALPGIMRGRILNAGGAKVGAIADIARIEAMILTSSLIGARRVASLDGRHLDEVDLAYCG